MPILAYTNPGAVNPVTASDITVMNLLGWDSASQVGSDRRLLPPRSPRVMITERDAHRYRSRRPMACSRM